MESGESVDINKQGDHTLVEEKLNYPQQQYAASLFSLPVKISACGLYHGPHRQPTLL